MIKLDNEKKTFKEKWNEPIDKNDLKKTLIRGLIGMILGVIIAVFIDLLLVRINANFCVGAMIVGSVIGLLISGGFKEYHIKYSLIAVCYTIVGLILLNLMRLLAINNFSNIGAILSSGDTYYLVFLYPIRIIHNAIRIGQFTNYIFAIIEFVIIIVSIFVAYYVPLKKQSTEEE